MKDAAQRDFQFVHEKFAHEFGGASLNTQIFFHCVFKTLIICT